MSVLDSIIQWRQMEDAKRNADLNAIPQIINTFAQARQQALINDLTRRKTEAEIANIESEISTRKGRSQIDDLLKLGQVADTAKKVGNRDLFNTARSAMNTLIGAPGETVNQYVNPQVANAMPTVPVNPHGDDAELYAQASEIDPMTDGPTPAALAAKSLLESKKAQKMKDIEISSEVKKEEQKNINKLARLDKIVDVVSGEWLKTKPGSGLGGRMSGFLDIAGSKLQLNENQQQDAAYISFVKGIRAQLARAMGDVGNLSEFEQKAVMDLIPSIADTKEVGIEKIKKIKSFIGALGNKSGEPGTSLESIPTGENPRTNTPASFYSEVVSPILSGASTFAAGIPKAAAKADIPGVFEAMYPEQQTAPGKMLRGVSELVGFTAGLPAKAGTAAVNIAGKIIPKLGPTAKLSIGGAASLSSLTPEKEGEFDILSPAERAQNAVTGAIIPGAMKVVGNVFQSAGKAIQNTVFGKRLADYARENRWSNILKNVSSTGIVPEDIKNKMVNFFPNAKNAVGQKLRGIIQKKYGNVHVPTQQIQNETRDLLEKMPIEMLDITPLEKKTLMKIADTILQYGQNPTGHTSKSFAQAQFITIPKLWEMRKDADILVRNFPLRKDEAKLFWQGLRRTMNSPIRNSGKDVSKLMNDYEFLSSAEDEIGMTFEGVINKNTGEIHSQKISSFLQGLFSGKDKGETLNLMKNVESYSKLNDAVLKKAEDYAMSQQLKSLLDSGGRSTGLQDFIKNIIRIPTAKFSAKVQDLERLLPAKKRDILDKYLTSSLGLMLRE